MLHNQGPLQKKASKFSNIFFNSFTISRRACAKSGFVYTSYPANSAAMEIITGIQKRIFERRLYRRYIQPFSFKTQYNRFFFWYSIRLYTRRKSYLLLEYIVSFFILKYFKRSKIRCCEKENSKSLYGVDKKIHAPIIHTRWRNTCKYIIGEDGSIINKRIIRTQSTSTNHEA